MSILRRMLDKWKGKRPGAPDGTGRLQREADEDAQTPPVIDTPWGPVTESARHRAALNMREDPEKRADVELLLARQMFDGDVEKGKAESRKRYREAYPDLDGTY